MAPKRAKVERKAAAKAAAASSSSSKNSKHRNATTTTSGSGGNSNKNDNNNNNSNKKQKDLPPCAGYLISCDVPTKQYIVYLNEQKPVDKKFILDDLDATHLLVKRKAREEIERKVESWMDENVFSAVERVGEDLGVS